MQEMKKSQVQKAWEGSRGKDLGNISRHLQSIKPSPQKWSVSWGWSLKKSLAMDLVGAVGHSWKMLLATLYVLTLGEAFIGR